MTRTIKATEIKEGMTVQFQVEVDFVREHRDWVTFFRDDGRSVGLDGDIEVKVLSEPQPEEPTAFGARVVADGMLFVRADDDANPWRHLRAAMWVNWRDVCALGEVTVIDADPSWTVPEQATEAPVVPDLVMEWPKDDTELRPYQWEDIDGCPWRSFGEDDWRFKTWEGGWSYPPRPTPADGPWTRVSDA